MTCPATLAIDAHTDPLGVIAPTERLEIEPVASVLLTHAEHDHLTELVTEALTRRLVDVAEGNRHAADLSPDLSRRVVALLAHPQFAAF